jgi:hypothetical protein
MNKKRILVFPCGSEIGLEIHRSLRYSTHFELVGGSSVDDHGRFIFEEYVGGLPYHQEPDFESKLKRVLAARSIDAIYPAMDAVMETVSELGESLGVKVIGSSPAVASICASKTATYQFVDGVVPVPRYCHNLDDVDEFPIFIKPDRGYGSRNTLLAFDRMAAQSFLGRFERNSMLMTEHLPGQEWTVDCFSDRHGKLRFSSARIRSRISNGISVHTKPCISHQQLFASWAELINEKLCPRGAWFFQAKQGKDGHPKLLEIAARLGGSSGLFRCKGINFALLSAFDTFDMEVSIEPNSYQIEMDRALDNRYRLDISYDHVFVDLDDCVIVGGKINLQLVSFLYKTISDGKGVTLITRHHRDPHLTLRDYRISELFDRVIHITSDEKKSVFVDHNSSIFIDDSFAERQDVAQTHRIPVFAPDMIEALI